MTSREIPSTRTALVKAAPGQAVITTQTMPALKPGYMLVQTKAVALNPADWMDIDYVGDDASTVKSPPRGLSPSQSRYEGCVPGLDYAGIVVRVELRSQTDNYLPPTHPNHLKSFQPGDRVCGLAYGHNAFSPAEGAFADYIVVRTELQMHMPEHMSFEEAASLGVGVLAAGMGLFQVSKRGIPSSLWDATVSEDDTVQGSDDDGEEWILVYGGSTATGSIAIQWAKLAGYKVVTTCSPRNFELVKRVGADAVLDYNNADISSLIRSATGDTLRFVFDAVATDETAAICVASLASSSTNKGQGPALYISLLNPKLPENLPVAVEKRFFLGYSCWGYDYFFEGEVVPAAPDDYRFGVELTRLAEVLLAKGKLTNHPIGVNENSEKKGGLEGVLMGLDLLRKGAVSGRKLVYRM